MQAQRCFSGGPLLTAIVMLLSTGSLTAVRVRFLWCQKSIRLPVCAKSADRRLAVMRILDKYLGRTVATATATVILFLVAAFTFFAFLDELNDTGRGGYTLLAALQFVVLRIPALTYQMFPVAALIGALLGLGTLVANSEMVAVRAAGVSLARTIRSVMKA